MQANERIHLPPVGRLQTVRQFTRGDPRRNVRNSTRSEPLHREGKTSATAILRQWGEIR